MVHTNHASWDCQGHFRQHYRRLKINRSNKGHTFSRLQKWWHWCNWVLKRDNLGTFDDVAVWMCTLEPIGQSTQARKSLPCGRSLSVLAQKSGTLSPVRFAYSLLLPSSKREWRLFVSRIPSVICPFSPVFSLSFLCFVLILRFGFKLF